MLLCFFSLISFKRGYIFNDEVALWNDAVGKSSSKARPHNNLGKAYEDKGYTDLAMEEYLVAIKLRPRYAPAHSNLASIYNIKGMRDDEERELKLAISYGPPFEDLHRRLGLLYIKKGLLADALKEIDKGIVLISDHPHARRDIAIIYNNEAFLYTDRSDFNRAMILHLVAYSIDPSHINVHYGLALAYEALGETESSIGHWKEYLRLAPANEPFRKDAINHLEGLTRLDTQ